MEKERAFGHFFELVYERTLTNAEGLLSKDFSLFTNDGKFVRGLSFSPSKHSEESHVAKLFEFSEFSFFFFSFLFQSFLWRLLQLSRGILRRLEVCLGHWIAFRIWRM